MPEDICKCISAGVLPVCFENTAIDVKLQEQSAISRFTVNEDGTVMFLISNILAKVKVRAVKWHDGAYYVLCKGIEASVDLGLSFLAYNLRRAIQYGGNRSCDLAPSLWYALTCVYAILLYLLYHVITVIKLACIHIGT